ncbi:MAG: hypothetical protein ACKO1F_12440, partial [Flammeovirgaceae bacterium]
MKKLFVKYVYTVILLLLYSGSELIAQSTERHSFNYNSIRFEDAIFALTKTYGVKFSYGSQEVPIDRLIALQVTDKTLIEVLAKILPP